MEFHEFIKNLNKMCSRVGDCDGCPLPSSVGECRLWCFNNPEKAGQIVEQWTKEHPIVTNADKFKEVFGKPIGSYGAPCPNGLTIYENGTMSNIEWLEQEYKEPTLD